MKETFHLLQIKDVAVKLWQQYNQYKIWAFNASMGAGKTTLIHALGEVLEINSAVSSPTFAIINEYTSPVAGIVYHMDWYRLKNDLEIVSAGCEDCINSGNLCLIEWAEKAPGLLSQNTLQLNIEIVSNFERRLNVNSNT